MTRAKVGAAQAFALSKLLLWLPVDYRNHILLLPRSMIIASRQIFLAFDDGTHWSNQWTACWHKDVHQAAWPFYFFLLYCPMYLIRCFGI